MKTNPKKKSTIPFRAMLLDGGLLLVTAPPAQFASPPGNPNRMPDEEYRALVASIRTEGFLQPLLAVPTGEALMPYACVDGEHRLRAAKELGIALVPALVAEGKTREQIQALRVSMNKIRGQLDLGEVASILANLESAGWSADDLTRTGYSPSEIQALVGSIQVPEIDELVAPPRHAPDPEPEAQPRPWVIELKFRSREDHKLAQRALRKAAGKSKDLARGLLVLLNASKKPTRSKA